MDFFRLRKSIENFFDKPQLKKTLRQHFKKNRAKSIWLFNYSIMDSIMNKIFIF